MDLTKTYIQEDIDLMISSNLEENIHLDFKASGSLQNKDANKKEISKDVSAFANSDGGIIIYGVSEKNYKADSIDGIDGNTITKEWLEQVITSNIYPRIQNLIIDVIRYNNEISATIYVVKIPRANKAHMAIDKCYYKRFNFSSEKMQEYEVRDLYFRKNTSDLEILTPKIISYQNLPTYSNQYGGIRVYLELNITNNGEHFENEYKYQFAFNPTIYLDNFEYPDKKLIMVTKIDRLTNAFSFPSNNTVFKDDILNICKFHFEVNRMLYSWDMEIKLFSSNGCKTKTFNILQLFNIENELAEEYLLKRLTS